MNIKTRILYGAASNCSTENQTVIQIAIYCSGTDKSRQLRVFYTTNKIWSLSGCTSDWAEIWFLQALHMRINHFPFSLPRGDEVLLGAEEMAEAAPAAWKSQGRNRRQKVEGWTGPRSTQARSPRAIAKAEGLFLWLGRKKKTKQKNTSCYSIPSPEMCFPGQTLALIFS